MYVPGALLADNHKRSPWIMLPISFEEIGYQSTLITGQCLIKNIPIEIYETNLQNSSTFKSIFEPFLGFRKIFFEEPDIVLISPIGSYLFTVIPLIMLYKLRYSIFRNSKTKFILKTDWSFDYSSLKSKYRLLANLIVIVSSHVFNLVSFETYCGVDKAKELPLIKKQTIKRIPLGYPQNVALNQSNNNSNREKVILCVARIHPMKGQNILIESFAKISKHFPDWKLRFIGPFRDSSYKQRLDELIVENNISHLVSFSGFITEDELYEELNVASIFCLPSVYNESAGNVKYEAISMGLPVVSTDVPCRKDDEEMGCIVANAGDVGDLYDKLTMSE